MPDKSISDEILILEQKREALERLISIVTSLESMADGLKASMELGKSAEELPLTLLKAYNSLGKKVRNSSDAEILSRIKTIDAVVKSKIQSILLLTHDKSWMFYEEESQKQASPLFDEVDNFVRLTHTNIALRVLIEKRTGKTLPFKNLIAESEIRKSVDSIEKSEAVGRKQVVKDIDVILKDVNALLSLGGISDSVRQHMEGVKRDLRNGLKHILSGKSIKELPIDIAVVTLTPVDTASLPEVKAEEVVCKNTTNKNRYEVEEKTELSRVESKATEKAPTKIQKDVNAPGSAGNLVRKERRVLSGEGRRVERQNLWARFCLWLNSPWSTSWSDLKSKARKKK